MSHAPNTYPNQSFVSTGETLIYCEHIYRLREVNVEKRETPTTLHTVPQDLHRNTVKQLSTNKGSYTCIQL
jgi:hypothetical protein